MIPVKVSIRKLDTLGRILIPVEFRQALGLEIGSQVTLSLEDDALVIRHPRLACTVCGSSDDIAQVGETTLCTHCRALLDARTK